MSFEDKKKALFASLDSAEKSIPSNSVLHQDVQSVEYSRQRRRPGSDSSSSRHTASRPEPIRKFRGKESIFKRPAAPIGKCLPMSRVPDFKKNPHKWTKYSLEDVDTSDRSNTAAAFSFLREIESQKRDQGGEEIDDGGPTEFKGKVRFNRSVKLQARLEELEKPPPAEEDKPKVKGCKVVMPEYVVGQKPKKARSGKVAGAEGGGSSKRNRSSELKLDHLMEEEEEDGDEEDDADGMD